MKIPKYMELVNWIKKKIETNELKYGSKLYSENELSSMFELSRQTVRQAIRILIQEKYLESRQGSGTYVIFNVHSKHEPNMVIGVITTFVDSYIFPQIIRGIETILTQNGYSMHLAFTYNKVKNESMVLRSMLSKGVDGLIVEPTKSSLPNPNKEIYQEIVQKGIPILFINSFYPELSIPHVAMNDHTAGFLATDYLIRAGHRKIAGVFKSDDNQGHFRYAGYLDALLNAGLEVQEENVLWYSTEDLEDFISDSQRILHRIGECSGLVCYNDDIALKMMDIFKSEHILVPKDLSVVGIDNSALAEVCETPLTSVAHPMSLLGETASKNLIHLIRDKNFEATVDFEPKLVERASVRSIPRFNL